MSKDTQIERERRWLVRSFDHSILAHHPSCVYIQGYFDVREANSFRIRHIMDKNGSRAVLTRKTGVGEVRSEFEQPVSLQMAQQLLQGTLHVLRKRRYLIEGGWELDIFEDALRGIVMLEFEARGNEEIPPLPKWITDAIDVTDDLTNLHLARMAKEISALAIEQDPFFLRLTTPHSFAKITCINTGTARFAREQREQAESPDELRVLNYFPLLVSMLRLPFKPNETWLLSGRLDLLAEEMAGIQACQIRAKHVKIFYMVPSTHIQTKTSVPENSL